MKRMLVCLVLGALSTASYADIDYFRLKLPTQTTKDKPQAFYCTVKASKSGNPRLLMGSHAQLITGFNNPDPDAQGQLVIYTNQNQGQQGLNQVYFNAYQDPKELGQAGYVQVIATGSTDITCALGNGDGKRTLMPGDYGISQ